MSWTVDATSGIALPQSSAEWTSFLASLTGIGAGISNPTSLYLLQEASGNFADSIGSITLTASVSPHNWDYAQAAQSGGWSVLGPWTAADNTATNATATNAALPDLTGATSASSLAFLAYYFIDATPSGVRDMFEAGAATLRVRQTAANLITLVSGSNSTTGRGNMGTGKGLVPTNGVVPFLVVVNKTAGTVSLYTSQEKLSVTPGTYASTKSIALGGTASGALTGNVQYLYAAMWVGSAAEMNDDQAHEMLRGLGWTMYWAASSDHSASIKTPQNAKDWTSVLTGTGISNPNATWPLSDPSGNFNDPIGGITLTATSISAYQAAVSGWSAVGPTFTSGSTSRGNSTSASLPDLSQTTQANSFSVLYYVKVVTPGANADLEEHASATLRLRVTTGPLLVLFSGSNSGTGTKNPVSGSNLVSGVIPILIVLNRTAGTLKMYTSQEVVSCTPGTMSATKSLAFGGSSSGSTADGATGLLGAAWWGANAEFTNERAYTLLTTLGWSTAWAAYTTAISETTSVAEAIAAVMGAVVGISETTSLAEAIAAAGGGTFTGDVSETTSLAEALTVLLSAIVGPSESTALAEALAALQASSASPSESTALAEAVAAVMGAVVSLSEATSLAEALVAVMVANVSESESVGLAEVLAAVYAASDGASESTMLGEALDVLLASSVSASEATTLAEAVAAALAAAVNPSEAVALAEAVAAALVADAEVAESAALGEVADVAVAATVAVAESTALGEGVTAGNVLTADAAESTSVGESLAAALAAVAGPSDTVSLGELAAVVAGVLAFAGESTALGEGASAGVATTGAVSDAVVLAEQLAAALAAAVAIAEALVLAEVIDAVVHRVPVPLLSAMVGALVARLELVGAIALRDTMAGKLSRLRDVDGGAGEET